MTTDLDSGLRRVARALVADPPPLPDWPLDDLVAAPEDKVWRWHLVGVAAVAVLAIGAGGLWLAVDSRTGPSSTDQVDVPATQPQLDPSVNAGIERFIVVGMNVDVAEETADGVASSLWQNTPQVGDTSQALPAVNINTGPRSSPDLTTWQRVGESVDVLGQTVELYTLSGDPLAVTLTTPIGTVVTIVGEGLDTEEFKNLLTRVRPLDANEWADLVDAHAFDPNPRASDSTDTSPTTAADGTLTTAPSGSNDSTTPLPDRSFELYTHCGINGAMIDGSWWEVSPELSDGNGNPPDGWGNPYQSGHLHFVDDATATFTAESDTGAQLLATLHRTASRDYPFICS